MKKLNLLYVIPFIPILGWAITTLLMLLDKEGEVIDLTNRPFAFFGAVLTQIISFSYLARTIL